MSDVNSMHLSEEFFKQIMLYIQKNTLGSFRASFGRARSQTPKLIPTFTI
jgi:hypothetical protein